MAVNLGPVDERRCGCDERTVREAARQFARIIRETAPQEPLMPSCFDGCRLNAHEPGCVHGRGEHARAIEAAELVEAALRRLDGRARLEGRRS
jgi:hypothetical protein